MALKRGQHALMVVRGICEASAWSRCISLRQVHIHLHDACDDIQHRASFVQKNVPMAVGGIGMISTANYVARKFGVRSAMPGFIARELCPQLVFAKPNFSKYTAASRASRVIFGNYDDDFSAGSLDEAHLDVTDYCALHGVTGAACSSAHSLPIDFA